MFGFGFGVARKRGTYTPPPPVLLPLSGSFTLAEDADAGAAAGAIMGKRVGSTLSLADDAGGRVALAGSGESWNVVRGASALDHAAAASHEFTVQEALPGATNTPRETVLTLAVTDVAEGPMLNTLVLGTPTAPALQTLTLGAPL